VPGLDRRRDLAQHGLALLDLAEVDQRADQQAVRASEEDAEGTAEDPHQDADEASAGRPRELVGADLVLDVDLAVLTADDDSGCLEAQPLLGVQLLQRGQRRVGVRVGVERHGDHVVRARRLGVPAVVL
jgi:hypothetical protein